MCHYFGRSTCLYLHSITIAHYSRKDAWLICGLVEFISNPLKFTLLLWDSGLVSDHKIYTFELCLPNEKLLYPWRDVRLPVIPERPDTDARIHNLVRRPWRHKWRIAFTIEFQSDNPPSNFFTDTPQTPSQLRQPQSALKWKSRLNAHFSPPHKLTQIYYFCHALFLLKYIYIYFSVFLLALYWVYTLYL